MKKAHILLVDDSVSDRVMVERALEDCRISCNLSIVSNGNEAIEFLEKAAREENLPDLVLMDINMPVMDGKEALKKIRQNKDFNHTPVMMLTTSNSERDVFESYQLGVNAYITKPITESEFLTKMKLVENFWFEIVVLPRGKS